MFTFSHNISVYLIFTFILISTIYAARQNIERVYFSDLNGTSDPNAIARLEAGAVAHLTVSSSSGRLEETGKGSLESIASVGSCGRLSVW